MKNKLTRKLMLSAFTLLFAVISLGASTYAWFTLSKDAEVEAFQGKVTSGTSGLEIGVGLIGDTQPYQWRATSLDLAADLNSLSEDILTKLKFDAVQNANPLGNGSFTGLDVTKKDSGYAGAVQYYAGQKVVNGEETEIKDGTYLSFQLFFRLADTNDSTENAKVYLTNYQMLTNPTEDLENGDVDGWHVNKDYKDINGTPVTVEGVKTTGVKPKYYVSDAARMAIVGKTAEQKHLIETNEYASSVNGYYSSGSQSNGALSYYNNFNGIEISLPDEYAQPTVGPETNQTKAGAIEICDLIKDNKYEGSATITIWIDGWDGECINAIFGQILCINLSFSLEEK